MKLSRESLQEYYRRTFYPGYSCGEVDRDGFYLVSYDSFNGSKRSSVFTGWCEALIEFEENSSHEIHIVDAE